MIRKNTKTLFAKLVHSPRYISITEEKHAKRISRCSPSFLFSPPLLHEEKGKIEILRA